MDQDPYPQGGYGGRGGYGGYNNPRGGYRGDRGGGYQGSRGRGSYRSRGSAPYRGSSNYRGGDKRGPRYDQYGSAPYQSYQQSGRDHRPGVRDAARNFAQAKQDQRRQFRGRPDQQEATFGSATFVVKGYPLGTPPEQVMNFLQQNAEFAYWNVETTPNGDQMRFEVPLRDADVVYGLNNIPFNGHYLRVERVGTRTMRAPSSIREVRTRLEAYLNNNRQRIFNEQANALTLAALNDASHCGIDWNKPNNVVMLLQVVGQIFPHVKTILFDNNGIRTLEGFANMHEYLKDLENVSFANNNITDFDQLNFLLGKKYSELMLRGNDIESHIHYRKTVQERMPWLKALDGQPLQPLISFNIPKHTSVLPFETLPSQVNAGGGDEAKLKTIIETFLKQFFNCYDSDRNQLLYAYANDAIFTLSIACVQASPAELEHYFGPYKHLNRNLEHPTTGDDKTEMHKLAIGPARIVSNMLEIPLQTRHRLEPPHFIYDVAYFSELGVAVCTVNGSFSEIRDKSQLEISFTRTFVLSPAEPNSIAAQHSWPVVIRNDQLFLRNHVEPTVRSS